MSSTNTAIASILLNTTPDRVWQALTNPAQIREYLFGTTASSEWKNGSTITYSGEWEGKKYEDKGKIIEIRPNELLHTTYFSNMSGLEDKPENYNNVFYKIIPAGNQVILTVVQDNCRDEKSRDHSETNWQYVLQSLKKLVEGNQ